MEPDQTKQALPSDPWADRASGMRCRTCLYFVRKQSSLPDDNGRGYQGRCRRNAPTLKGYPVVFESDWCGEHRLA